MVVLTVLTAPGAGTNPSQTSTSSLFPSPIPAMKAFEAIGPDSPSEIEYSSFDHSAPLLYLAVPDSSTCPRCCSSFSPSNTLPFSPLSPSVVSLVANRTVVVKLRDIDKCNPVVNLVSGLETMHVALASAGARAVVLVSGGIQPGLTASLVGSFSSPSDKRAAKSSLVPFVEIGSETGERLVKAVQSAAVEQSAAVDAAGSDSSASHVHNVHVTFKFDTNPFQEIYHNYVEGPFKFISFFTFALIVLRCHSLGLHVDPSTKLPLLNSTKNLLVLLALPVAGAIMTMVSLNGMSFHDQGSQAAVFFGTGLLFPGLNVSSSFVVARFWSSRIAHLAASKSGAPSESGATSESGASSVSDSAPSDRAFASDPAKTQPVRTLLIVFVGLASDVCFSISTIFFGLPQTRPVIVIVSVLLAICYILITAYFFRSGIQVLRSLSSFNKPLKNMASYLLLVAGFTLMIIVSFVMTGFQEQGSIQWYFILSFFYCKTE